MDGFSYQHAFRMAAGLALGSGCGIASAAAVPAAYLPGGVADAGLPTELAAMLWLPILVLTAVCGMGLIWMLNVERREARRQAAAERQRIAVERKAYRRAVDQYLRDARRARAQAQRENRQQHPAGMPVLGRLAGGKA